jgi:hypothetical protein
VGAWELVGRMWGFRLLQFKSKKSWFTGAIWELVDYQRPHLIHRSVVSDPIEVQQEELFQILVTRQIE